MNRADLRVLDFELQTVRVIGVEKVQYERTADEVRGRLLHSFTGRVLMTREQPYPMRWKVPANAWEHLKQHLVDRWPVLFGWLSVRKVEHSRELEVKTLLPHVTVRRPVKVPDLVTITVEDWPVATVALPPE